MAKGSKGRSCPDGPIDGRLWPVGAPSDGRLWLVGAPSDGRLLSHAMAGHVAGHVAGVARLLQAMEVSGASSSSPSLNIPKTIQEAEKEDEEDPIMTLDEDNHSHETTHKNEIVEAISTNNVLVESEENGISHKRRVEMEHNVEIIEESPSIECENAKVEEEVDSQAMIQNLDCEEPDFLGIEAFMQPKSHGIQNDKWKLNDYFVKATTSYKGEKEMSTKLAWANTAILSLKRIGHQSITSTTMALATLAIYGVDQDEFGELFPSLFTFQCPYNFLFHSYLIFALKWQDPP
ncbi:hypothetical protein CCACVL1_25426 [Corchorus capsularis]|uniref:Uncharacterized protein n=1 Tax=Corchorus capsularis TaxID=210143 RepID=A0A1R3GKI7_COCAP|nr:hypothetical protein CCACVL1_25426 [Corchorus capsularis]